MATAFERLFERLMEIAAIMENNEKKKAVRIIKEMPEFSDMTENTIKTNITSFPFLSKELDKVRQNLDKTETQELDRLRKENESLSKDLDSLRQDLSNFSQKVSKHDETVKELDSVKKENESLSEELANLRQNSSDLSQDSDSDMDMKKELRELEERVGAIETAMQGNLRQSLDNSLDKIPKKETSEFIDSWKIVFKNPYYKLYKTINGKLIWIHIGREFSEDVARKKIRQKLDKMKGNE